MPNVRVLVVDDDETVRFTLSKVMERNDFDVAVATGVPDALQQITSQGFDVLITDLHMPGPADGLTVVSAMRHANPKAITLLLSANPDLDAAASAIVRQADEVLVKPMEIPTLIDIVRQRLSKKTPKARGIESVATILERSIDLTVKDWILRVEKEPKLMTVPLERELRIAYVPTILGDLITRLRSRRPLGGSELDSKAAYEHGLLRRRQGYTPAMIVRESRLLQVSIFQTLENNFDALDFSLLLNQIMVIADEVDSQLGQTMESYMAEATID